MVRNTYPWHIQRGRSRNLFTIHGSGKAPRVLTNSELWAIEPHGFFDEWITECIGPPMRKVRKKNSDEPRREAAQDQWGFAIGMKSPEQR